MCLLNWMVAKDYNPNNYDDNVNPSLTFDWTQTGRPTVILNNPTSANPTFTSPQVEETTRLTFQLVVSSDTKTSNPDSVTVFVNPSTTILKPIADAGTDLGSKAMCLLNWMVAKAIILIIMMIMLIHL